MKLTQLRALASASVTGLVAMRIDQAFTPYNEGDIAGFQPEEAHKLLKAKILSVPEGVDAPETVDEDDDDAGGDGTKDPVVKVEDLEIPTDWETQHYLKNRALAAKIAGRKVEGKEDVADVIRTELARREAAQA